MDLSIYKPAIYKINTSSGSGTGFFIANKRFLITNHHVVQGHKEVSVEDFNQNRFLGKVVYINPKVDVAFVFIEESTEFPTSPIVIKETNSIQEQDRLFVLGFPFGMPFTITEGIVSSPEQPMGGRKYVQTDAAVNPGNSGGPMLNENGDLTAITTCKFNDADNVGFGIPFSSVMTEIENYEKGESLDQFALACPSCHALIYELTEYCHTCGSKIEKTLFEDIKLDEVSKFVETSLNTLGINPVLTRNGREDWKFYYGSASIRIYVYDEEYIYANSHINNLPQKDLKELYQYMLSQPISPYKLGINNFHQIVITYAIHLNDLLTERKEQIMNELHGLATKANEMDYYLLEQFKCPMSENSKKELRRECIE